MDVSDVIARREFMPTYIWLDVAFLIGFAALLVWRRKYMMLPVGLVMGGVYFARGLWRVQSADAFTFDQRRQHVLGAAVDERKLWVHELLMAVVVAEPRPPSGGMVDADSHLVVLLPVDVADVYGPVRVRHAADCHPTHDRRVPRGMAVILSRRRMVGHAVCRRSAWIPADQARDRRRYPKHLMYERTGISPTLLYSRTTIVRTACQRWFSNHPAQSTTASMLLPSGSSTNAE
ncbi:hypothetical protein [Bifidobacterium bifidum]|uniref:hypothetical protein n=1 Tax=Bifidobacterium bifidum TaxID=1681 RepID=UPI001E37C02F|nr:hypothetical protein [Bifidobacterium bifidum]